MTQNPISANSVTTPQVVTEFASQDCRVFHISTVQQHRAVRTGSKNSPAHSTKNDGVQIQQTDAVDGN